jgi:xylan 1,4-beta-xylosidase
MADVQRVMHATPGDHNFEASVKLEPEKSVEAGLVLYYGPKALAGIGFRDGFIFSLSRGELTSNAMIEAPQARHLKIRLFEHDLTMLYSDDGLHWKTYPASQEVSGYEQNMLGGFSGLKIGVYGQGEGQLRIADFRYRVLEGPCF